MTTPADEITTVEAATLLGISGAMLRRVAGQGYMPRPQHGHERRSWLCGLSP